MALEVLAGSAEVAFGFAVEGVHLQDALGQGLCLRQVLCFPLRE